MLLSLYQLTSSYTQWARVCVYVRKVTKDREKEFKK